MSIKQLVHPKMKMLASFTHLATIIIINFVLLNIVLLNIFVEPAI